MLEHTDQHRLWTRAYVWAVRVAGYFLLVAALFALQNPWIIRAPKFWLFFAVLLGLIAVRWLVHPAGTIDRPGTRYFLAAVILLYVLTRTVWIVNVPTVPVSDFKAYHDAALQIARGDWNLRLKIAYLGYPLMLAVVYRIFNLHPPETVLAAQALHVVLGICTVLLIFHLAHLIGNERTARVACILFVLWPTQLMWTGVLASEHLFVPWTLLGIAILVRALQGTPIRARSLFTAGLVLGVATIVRPIALLIVLVGVGLVTGIGRDTLRQRGLKIAGLLFGFLIVPGVYHVLLPTPTRPSTTFTMMLVHSLSHGTNVASRGRWSHEEFRALRAIRERYGPEKSVWVMLHRVLHRIRTHPFGFIRMVFEKFQIQWARDLYGAHWSTRQVRPVRWGTWIRRARPVLFTVAQFYYVWLLLLCVAGCVRFQAFPPHIGVSVILLLFFMSIGVHTVLVAMARYHYPWVILLTILGARGLTLSIEETA